MSVNEELARHAVEIGLEFPVGSIDRAACESAAFFLMDAETLQDARENFLHHWAETVRRTTGDPHEEALDAILLGMKGRILGLYKGFEASMFRGIPGYELPDCLEGWDD